MFVMLEFTLKKIHNSGGSKGGARGMRTPLGAQILSILCSFWENLAKSYVCAPPWGVGAPPRGNPGSASVVMIRWIQISGLLIN